MCSKLGSSTRDGINSLLQFVIASVSSALQIVLCFRDPETGKTPNQNIHIPDSVFALGDDVVMAASNQLLSMPILILMSRLCPEGAGDCLRNGDQYSRCRWHCQLNSFADLHQRFWCYQYEFRATLAIDLDHFTCKDAVHTFPSVGASKS